MLITHIPGCQEAENVMKEGYQTFRNVQGEGDHHFIYYPQHDPSTSRSGKFSLSFSLLLLLLLLFIHIRVA